MQKPTHSNGLGHQTLGRQAAIDGSENPFGEFVRLQQAPALEQGGGIGCRFTGEIDADNATDGLAVLDCVFRGFIGESKTLLGEVNPQHPFQANRWPTATFALGVERFRLRDQLGLRRDRLDLVQETIPSHYQLLGGILQVGKASLHRLYSARSCSVNPLRTLGVNPARFGNISARPYGGGSLWLHVTQVAGNT